MKILRMGTNKARKYRGGSACDFHTLDEAGKYPVIGASDHAIPLWRPQGRTCQCHRDEEADEDGENDHPKPSKLLPKGARSLYPDHWNANSWVSLPWVVVQPYKRICDEVALKHNTIEELR